MKAETRQKLFSYMSNEHGLNLLENELDEIERILGDKIKEAMKDIEADCEIHKTKAGDEFSGISWAQVSRIMEKYGYESEIPF